MHQFLFAPYVIAWRSVSICLSIMQPTPARSRENARMVTEKYAAAFDGAFAMQTEMARASFAVWSAALTGRSPVAALQTGAERVAEAAMKPAARAVGANARRLSRRRSI